jgi:hypothetical protein
MTLPFVPTDSANEKQHRTLIATTLNELVKLYPREGSWTAVIEGSSVTGTYEIASQICRYTRIGRRVWLDVGITMAGSLTGGGSGDLYIANLPFIKAANTFPVGNVAVYGVDWTAGVSLSLSFYRVDVATALTIRQTADNAVWSAVPISGLSAGDLIFGSICYETDDP